MKTIMLKSAAGYASYARLADIRLVEGCADGCIVTIGDGNPIATFFSSEPAVEVWKKWVEAS